MPDWRPLDLLPGLYALALAALLLTALRRWFDPLPRRALLTFAVVLLPLLAPVLFGGRLLLPLDGLRIAPPFERLPPTDPPGNPQLDLLQQIAPTQLVVRRAAADGRWPLWDPLVAAGIPLLADPQSQVFQPLVFLAYPFPLAQAAGITAFLRLFVALAFMFLLLRRQGLGEPASLCGSLAYGLSGFLLIWLGWPIVNAAALLPAVLYAVVRLDESGRRADRLLLWLALFALLAAGHPEAILYAGALAAAFLLARVRRRPRGARLRLLAAGAMTAALAAGAAAPAWLPMLEHLPKSERAEILEFVFRGPGWPELRAELADPEARAAWRTLAGERLLAIPAPFAFGASRLGHYWGDVNSNENSTGFAGTATLLLALLGLAAPRRLPQERLVWGVLLAALLLLAQPPGLAALVFELPLVGATAAHHNRRVLLLVAFALPYLAACTVERLRRGELARRAPLVVAWALLLALLIGWAYVAHPQERWLLAELRTRWLWGQLAALAAAAAIVLAAARWRGPARSWAPALLAAVVAVELLAAHGPENPPMPKRLAFPAPPPVAFLRRHLAAGERMIGLGSVFRPNLPSLYGLADVRVYNPVTPAAYHHFVYPLTRSPGWLIPEFGRPRHALYDLLGVRYALTRAGVRHKQPLRRVLEDPDGWIYERPRPLPRLFLPATAEAYPPDLWRPWLERNRDFARRAVVERLPDGRGRWAARAPEGSTLRLTRLEPARIDAAAALAEPRLLASGVFADGNWRLLAAGRRRPIERVNGPLAGGWLPAGDFAVHLLYRPPAFVAGCALGAVALALLAAWTVPPPARREEERHDGDGRGARRHEAGEEAGRHERQLDA
jgi:hypothetical protein